MADRELSRRHSGIVREGHRFFLVDSHSTNGTYMRLEGPYAGPCALALDDQILVARTGFSINRFDYGVAEETGARKSMEDRTVVVQDLDVVPLRGTARSPQTFAAVFDGHGGAQASSFLRSALHGSVKAAVGRVSPDASDAVLGDALTRAFLECDDAFLNSSEKPSAGSTCVSALLLGRRLVCANVGDSRALLARSASFERLSTDHKPARADEAARIRAAGGFVIHKRVMGELAVSRAFGDADLKRSVTELAGDAPPPPPGASAFPPAVPRDARRLVVADPELVFAELRDDDAFVLLACDGLFDVFSDAEVIDFARAQLAAHGDPQAAAEALAAAAIHDRGSRDNVSVVLLALPGLA